MQSRPTEESTSDVSLERRYDGLESIQKLILRPDFIGTQHDTEEGLFGLLVQSSLAGEGLRLRCEAAGARVISKSDRSRTCTT